MKKIKCKESSFYIWMVRVLIITILLIVGLSFIDKHLGGYVIVGELIIGLILTFILEIEHE